VIILPAVFIIPPFTLYENKCTAAARILLEWFKVMKGVRQGCIISPNLFNIYAEIVLRKTLENSDGGIRIGGCRITNLRYADDIVLLAATEEELQDLVNRLRSVGEEYGLGINHKCRQN